MTDATQENQLNPGIRKTVEWLQEMGFDTCDSGDGETHEFECDREVPYVCIQVDSSKLVEETDRLYRALTSKGVIISAVSEDETVPFIQGSYDPSNEFAVIDLQGVSDRDLFREVASS